MNIYSSDQIRQIEDYAQHRGWVREQALMEEAASKSVDWLVQAYGPDTVFVILAGPGKNGGDGLAVCRMLRDRGYTAKAYLFPFRDPLAPATLDQEQKLRTAYPQSLEWIPEGGRIEGVGEHTVILDALLGLGLNRPAQGWVGEMLARIDRFPQQKIALDIPSGLPADRLPEPGTPFIRAQTTLCYHFIKRSFLHEEGARVSGHVVYIPLSIPAEAKEAVSSLYSVIQTESMKKIFKPRDRFSHKGSLGHGLLLGGSKGMLGAALLMAEGALRAGIGKLSLRVPSIGYTLAQSQVPEALCSVGGTDYLSDFGDPQGYQAIGLGPGMGTRPETGEALDRWLDRVRIPLVIDADALNLLAKNKDTLHRIPPESILSPHPKEFDRLFGPSDNSMERMEKARHQSMKYNLHILLKGHYTQILSPDGSAVYLNQYGAGLATAGSGDVLTGILTGMLAQGYTPSQAARLGAYLHGLAGEKAANLYGEESMIAGDIPKCLGAAFKHLAPASPPGPWIEGLEEDHRNS